MSDMYFRIIMCSLCHLVAALALKGTAITIKAFVKQHSTSVQQAAVLYEIQRARCWELNDNIVDAARSPARGRLRRATFNYRLLPLPALDFFFRLEIGAGCGSGAITRG